MSSARILCSALALASLAPAAVAAELAGPARIGEIVVTATRAPAPLDRVGQQITVLDRADLKAQQTPVLADILARTPGVSLSRNGGVGSATSLYLRGAAPGQSLVLVDGVKLNDPSAPDAGLDFGQLLVGDITRVEVLRGPESVLWGSQAIGGVIDLVTAAPRKRFEADATAEGGSHDWGYGRIGLGGMGDRLSWRVSSAYLTTRGISAFAGGSEPDGYRNIGASGRANVRLTENVSLDVRAVYTRGRTEFDGFPPPQYVFADDPEYGVNDTFLGYAGLNFDVGALKNRLAYQRTRSLHENFDPDQPSTDVTFKAAGRNARVEYQGTYALPRGWSAVFGGEFEQASLRTAAPSALDPSPARVTRRAELAGVYLQARGEIAPDLTLAAGVRHDHHSDFGGHTVGQASLAWRLNGGDTILRASWGQGFKAPSLYQLGSEYGNAGLKPETAEGWDAGVEQRLLGGRVTASLAYFQRRTRDEIDFLTCPPLSADPLCAGASGPRFGHYANVGRTRAKGAELALAADVTERLSTHASYSWLDARNGSGERLPRRPQHQGEVEAAYRWPGELTTTLAVRYAGARYDDVGNSRRLASYALVDLRASYPLRPDLELYGRVENLLDRRYETIHQYGALGRAAYVGLRARF